MLDWKYRDQVIKNQLVPTNRTVCYSDADSENRSDCHKCVAFNPRGTLTLITGSKKLSLFDTLTGNLFYSHRFDEELTTAIFSHCQRFIYIASNSGIHSLDLCAPESPVLQMSWLTFESPIVAMVPSLNAKFIILLDNGSVITVNSGNRENVQLTLKPTALAVSERGTLAVSDGPGLQILSESMNFHCADGLAAVPALEVQWISENPVTVLVRQKDTISFYRLDGGVLHCYHQLRDSINRVTYLAAAVCPGQRPLLALSSRETGKCKLDIIDLTTAQHIPLVRLDVTRLSEISSISWLPNAPGRSFVTVFTGGSSVLWTHAIQAKRDNWQTFVPNLTSCFMNMPHPEQETEFDFNVKGDKGVVNRYKSGSRVWDFGQGDIAQGVDKTEVDDELVPGEPVYPFMDLSRFLGRYAAAEQKVSDRHFTMTGETIIFDSVVE